MHGGAGREREERERESEGAREGEEERTEERAVLEPGWSGRIFMCPNICLYVCLCVCVCVSGESGANQEPARPGPRRHLDRRISVARNTRARKHPHAPTHPRTHPHASTQATRTHARACAHSQKRAHAHTHTHPRTSSHACTHTNVRARRNAPSCARVQSKVFGPA